MGKIRSAIVTGFVMGMIWTLYSLTDKYAWGFHQIINDILVVAGMIGIALSFYIFLRVGGPGLNILSKPKKQPWEAEYKSGQWQR